MAIYAIGDIQGCYDELRKLLDKINFDEGHDTIWFTGDLVNRGPKSLKTLRFVKELGDAAVTVLGNHDLHLLAASCNPKKNKKDTLQQVLDASDSEELLDWLRNRPLLHHNDKYCLVHAGLPPQWKLQQAEKMAVKVEKILQGNDYRHFLKEMYGNKPDIWSENLKGIDLHRFIVNCFTRMRYCHADGKLNFDYNGAPGSQPKDLVPWFQLPDRKSKSITIIFGHWSTLGLYSKNNCYAIDTGCLWGGQLTALKLGDKMKPVCLNCPGY